MEFAGSLLMFPFGFLHDPLDSEKILCYRVKLHVFHWNSLLFASCACRPIINYEFLDISCISVINLIACVILYDNRSQPSECSILQSTLPINTLSL